MATVVERLKRIQDQLGVEADGQLGPQTLSAIEKAVFGKEGHGSPVQAGPAQLGLRLSKSGIEQIVAYEIGSPAYYDKQLQSPCWPGGQSGVTIGIGYDLGYASRSQFAEDWQPLPDAVKHTLIKVLGLKGHKAKRQIASLRNIKIPYAVALDVFTRSSLPSYASKTLKAYPGLDQLHPDAQVALISLVYNRGTSTKGATRTEMLNLRRCVAESDYSAMAKNIRSMKRLWVGKGLDGLLKRREHEAHLIETVTDYELGELVHL
ncbi:glycoside hydrolase family protein [Aliagarivorans taiwanensis]|uniref:glycoside hydrolase family protein n=1 Tax=Aliagarivorans taiwanensis TaxID=561966 RepID=UPI00040EF980|nr:hypothetical protein [Aliagarivorans taiwanensis]